MVHCLTRYYYLVVAFLLSGACDVLRDLSRDRPAPTNRVPSGPEPAGGRGVSAQVGYFRARPL